MPGEGQVGNCSIESKVRAFVGDADNSPRSTDPLLLGSRLLNT